MNNIEIIGKMVGEDSQAVSLAPLCNITSIVENKEYTEVTIAAPTEVIRKLNGNPSNYIGGLLLVEKDEYKKFAEKYE